MTNKNLTTTFNELFDKPDASEIPLPSTDFYKRPLYKKSDAVVCANLSLFAYDFTNLAQKLENVEGTKLLLRHIIDRASYSTQAFIATSAEENTLYIAFRGSYEIIDWILDIEIFTYTKIRGKNALSAFVTRFNDVYDELQNKIVPLLQGRNRIYITGHSLGGALSQLTAYSLREDYPYIEVVVYTFGAPPFIGQDFKTTVALLDPAKFGSFNICDELDFVANGIVSATEYLGYHHFPQRIMLNGNSIFIKRHCMEDNYLPLSRTLPEKDQVLYKVILERLVTFMKNHV